MVRKYQKKRVVKKRNYRKKAPIRKKTMVRARAPLVECKKNTALNHSYQEIASQVMVLVPDSWMIMQQGTQDNNMVGNNLFTKYINHKMFLSFANCDTIPYNANIRVLCGWYKTPPNMVENIESIPGGTRRGLYGYNPEVIIKNQISKDLDNPLGTIDKTTFRITRDYLINGTPKVSYNTTATPSVPTFLREGKLIKCSWSPMKKIKYLPASEEVSGAFTHYSPANATKQWIPFMCLYFGNFNAFGAGKRPTYILENHHYFTDS